MKVVEKNDTEITTLRKRIKKQLCAEHKRETGRKALPEPRLKNKIHTQSQEGKEMRSGWDPHVQQKGAGGEGHHRLPDPFWRAGPSHVLRRPCAGPTHQGFKSSHLV